MSNLFNLDLNFLLTQTRTFAQESLLNYLVGLPLIFAVMLLIYGIIKFVFAGSSQPDKEKAKHQIIVAITIFILVFVGFAVFGWLAPFFTTSAPPQGIVE